MAGTEQKTREQSAHAQTTQAQQSSQAQRAPEAAHDGDAPRLEPSPERGQRKQDPKPFADWASI